MSGLRRSAALLPLVGLFAWAAPPALSQGADGLRSFQLAQRGGERARAEEEEQGKRERGGERQRGGEREGRRGSERGSERGADRAKPDGARRPRGPAPAPPRDRGQQQKQEAGQDRQRPGGRQRPDDDARQRAAKQKADEEARQRAAKQKQDDEARQRAAKQKRDEDTARQRAAQQKQEAEQARQRAAKQKQDEDSRQRAARQKQDADTTRKQRQARPDPKDAAPPARFDRRKADQDFERARKQARDGAPGTRAARPADAERWQERSVRRFEDVRKKRTERSEGGRNVIVEPDNRVIVRQKNRTIIRHDDNRRLKRAGRETRRERQKDGTWLIVTAGLAGALIYTLQDDHGRVLRRSRRDSSGRDYVLFDNRRHYYQGRGTSRTYDPYYDPYVTLPPPRVRIPREQYIVEYEGASVDDIYDALMAPPVEELERRYSLDEVRYSYSLLERLRRVDLDAVNFDFGSWEVTPDQYPKLEHVADAIHRILEESPDEVFLLEGHTDAVGSDIDNLSLSDRRAESVAIALTEEFEIPPENLMTQGYGKYHLKVQTEAPLRANRRVAVRRITPLLDREGWDEDVSGLP